MSQGLDQRSKMEEIMLKMACRTGSGALRVISVKLILLCINEELITFWTKNVLV